MSGDTGAFDLAAAVTRRTQGDLQPFMEGLAARIETALPTSVVVCRKRKSLFSARTRVAEIKVITEAGTMALALEDGRLTARRFKVVHDVTISSQEITVSSWLDELARLIAASSESAQIAHSSLREFLMS